MNTLVLTPDELVELTCKTERAQKRFSAQEKELEHLGIPYIRRSDKTLIVFRRIVDPGDRTRAPKDYEPDFDALKPKVSL
jgi:hypothetical protein